MIKAAIKKKLRTNMGRDIAWTIGSQVSVMMVLLVTNKLIAYYWPVSEFGLFNVIKRTSNVISFVLLGGLGITLPRYLSIAYKDSVQRRHILCASIVYYLIILCITVGVLYIAYPFCLYKLGIPPSKALLFSIIIYSVSVSLFTFFYSYLRGVGLFKAYSIKQTIYQLILFVGTCILFIFNINCTYLFLWWAIFGIIYLLINILEQYKQNPDSIKIKIHKDIFKSKFSQITIYSLPRLFADFILFSISAFPVIYISKYHSLEITSYYSVGITFVTMINPVFSFLGVVLLPFVSKCLYDNKLSEAKSKISQILKIYLIIGLFFTAILYYLMPFWIKIFFADKYLAITEICQLTILSIVPSSLYLLYRNPIDAITVFPWNLINLFCSFILLIILFIYNTDLKGYAMAFLYVAIFQGLFSIILWHILYRKQINH